MWYKCTDCGHLFEDGEEATWFENVGEAWGRLCEVRMKGCPMCKGNYVETKECIRCGRHCFEEDLVQGVCPQCAKEYIDNLKYDIDKCYEYGERCKEKVEMNGFLVSLFNIAQLEKLLLRELKEIEKYSPINCESFINSDEEWILKQILKDNNNL